jgi:drug/metabolite transporter (DMT)-like permease
MVPVIVSDVTVGFGAAVLAAGCYDGSYALQALEARDVGPDHGLHASLLKQLVRRPRWLLAIGMSFAGMALQLWALTLAPLTLVQPTLALGLLLLLYLGVRFLHERVGPREIGAVLAIVIGVGLIAYAAPNKDDAIDAGTMLFVVLGVLLSVTAGPYFARAAAQEHGWPLILSAGAADAVSALAAKLASDALERDRPLLALGMVIAAGAVLLVGLTSETTALQRIPATKVAPVVLVMQIAIPVLLAPVLVGENWGNTPLGGAVILAGLAAVAAGTFLLASSGAVSDLVAGEIPRSARRGELEHERSGGG